MDFLLLERRIFEEGIECKIGVDTGGGFLKCCLNISSNDDFIETVTKRRKFSDDFKCQNAKNTSVKKLIILAIVPNVKESYENVHQIFQLLNFDKIDKDYHKIRYAADLKMINILLGLMSHSSAHPCSWCTIDK